MNTEQENLLALFDEESTATHCEICGSEDVEIHPDLRTEGGLNLWCTECGYKQTITGEVLHG